MYDDLFEMNPWKMKQYTDFLETQCQKIKTLCDLMEADMTIATHAMDDINGKLAAKALERNVANIRSNMPIYTDVYDRLFLARKMLLEMLGEGGGN